MVQAQAGNREIGNLIYNICDEELRKRDQVADRQYRVAESKRVWAAVPAKKRPRILKRRKLTARAQMVNF